MLRPLLKGLALMAGLCLVAWVLGTGASHWKDTAWIDVTVRGRGWQGVAWFLGVGAVAVAAGLPRQAVSFAGGYAFGFIAGTAWTLIATLAGCAAAFSYARLLARGTLRRRFPARIQRLDDFLKDHPVSMTILVRFLPFTNNLLTNLAAGVSSVPATPFFVGSLLGYVPQTLIFTLLGSGAHDGSWRIAMSVALFVASTVMGVVLYRQQRRAV